MGENKGFTLLEVLIFAVMTSFILLVLFTTIGFGKETWNQLALELDHSYALRTVSSFLYREARLMDKDEPIVITSNGVRGSKISYQTLHIKEHRTIEASQNYRLYCRVGGAVYIWAENLSYIDFTISEQHLKVDFILNGNRYELVIPWN